MDPKEITYEMVNRKLREISLARGKKGVDRQEQVHASDLQAVFCTVHDVQNSPPCPRRVSSCSSKQDLAMLKVPLQTALTRTPQPCCSSVSHPHPRAPDLHPGARTPASSLASTLSAEA